MDTLGTHSSVRSGEVSACGRLKPWPNGVTSRRKTQTCDGCPNGIAGRRKLDARRKKKHSSAAVCAHTSENDPDTTLYRLALGGQTMRNVRQLASEFELVQSNLKSSQVHTSIDQTESQIPASFKLAMTYDSVGVYYLAKKSANFGWKSYG